MKIFLFFLFFFNANADIVKTCDTRVIFPEDSKEISIKFEITKTNGKYQASTKFDEEIFLNDVKIEKFDINLDNYFLTKNMPDNPNLAESLIIHAFMLITDKDSEGAFSTGIDLKVVKKAKVYSIIDETVNIGMTAIIETYDEHGVSLGSYLGGFLVAPCD